jgi:hypothetical protein
MREWTQYVHVRSSSLIMSGVILSYHIRAIYPNADGFWHPANHGDCWWYKPPNFVRAS